MRLNRNKKSDHKETPGWLVSFTDMITLLLSFFILLQVFARERDQDLFYEGQGGFRRAIAGLGIPDWLFGQRDTRFFRHPTYKHPMEEDEENLEMQRVIDAEGEKIRKFFDDLRRLGDTKVSDYEGEPVRLLNTPITFAPADADLQESAKAFLLNFAADLRQRTSAAARYVHIIGLAPDQTAPRARWMLSARRAMAVEAFLTRILSAELKDRGTRVDAWGGGTGESWYGRAKQGPQQAFILLAIMESCTEE